MLGEIIRRQCACIEALNRLGFEDKDITPVWNDGRVGILLKVDDKEFRVGHVEDSNDPLPSEQEYMRTFTSARKAWDELSPGAQRRVYLASFDEDKLADLAVAIHKKGISIPALAEKEED